MGYIYIHTDIYIYTHVEISALSMDFEVLDLGLPGFLRFLRTLPELWTGGFGDGDFWWMFFFPMGFVGFFPWDLVDWLPCLVWYRFFKTQKQIQGRRWGGWTFFSKSEFFFLVVWISNTANNHSRNFSLEDWGIGSSWILPSPTFLRYEGRYQKAGRCEKLGVGTWLPGSNMEVFFWEGTYSIGKRCVCSRSLKAKQSPVVKVPKERTLWFFSPRSNAVLPSNLMMDTKNDTMIWKETHVSKPSFWVGIR